MRKIFEFHGGIHPPENKQQSLQKGLQELPLPGLVVMPLSLHLGAPAIPVVAVGDRVLHGQTIAEPAGGFSAAIHASISGTVEAIEERPVSHPSGKPGMAIVIRSDGSDEKVKDDPIEDYRKIPVDRLLARLHKMGVVGLGGAGFPSHIKLKPSKPVDTLIINAAECEPYITADHELLRSRADQVIEAIELLAYLLGHPANILIGIEDNKPDAVAALQAAIGDRAIEIVEVPTKYPSGGEKQLVQLLTGKEISSGGLPAHLGIVVHNPGTAVAALEAIKFGRAVTTRITTFTGEGVPQPGNYIVRVGTPVGEILKHLQVSSSNLKKVVFGGPMMGFAMPNLDNPLLKITNCVLVPSAQELPDPPPAQPCIRCGSCAEVCPAQLLPQQLLWFSQSKNHESLERHNLFDCIECGACSYVCPSNIPLVQYYRASKGAIRDAERERVASDRARVRFETRNDRIAREAQEKDARRKARSQTASASNASAETDLVAAAMARVKDKEQLAPISAEPTPQFMALQERAVRLKEKIADSEDASLRSKFEAEFADTEARLTKLEAESKPLAAVPQMDAAAQAIERAKLKALERAALPETDKLRDTIASLEKRIASARAKRDEAASAQSDTLPALETGLEKLEAKLVAARTQLEQLLNEPQNP